MVYVIKHISWEFYPYTQTSYGYDYFSDVIRVMSEKFVKQHGEGFSCSQCCAAVVCLIDVRGGHDRYTNFPDRARIRNTCRAIKTNVDLKITK